MYFLTFFQNEEGGSVNSKLVHVKTKIYNVIKLNIKCEVAWKKLKKLESG